MSAFDILGITPDMLPSSDYSDNQTQTKDAFAFKWAKRDTYESEEMKQASYNWLIERYCQNKPENLETLLGENNTEKIILDAGCGSGYSGLILFQKYLKQHHYLGIDISNAVWVAKQRFEELGLSGSFAQSSLTELDFIPDNSIDIIFSEGVLHHTDNTEGSLKYLSKKIKKGGLMMFYVYAKKAPIREFTDDYIREQLLPLTDEEAWEKLKPLTQLGIKLGKLDTQITIDQDIDVLGIKKGSYDLQRFFYWHICKMYYRSEFAFDEMNHINFDWFRPLNCHRHTPEEIRTWCEDINLDIELMNIQESGITVVARK